VILKRAQRDERQNNQTINPNGAGMDDSAALETLSTLLKVYGQHAVDTDSAPKEVTQSECDRWARHLLYGAPMDAMASPGTKVRSSDRDWPGATRFFTETRRLENEHFKSSLDGTRAAFWSLANALKKSLADDQANDADLKVSVERLQAATNLTSYSEMKSSVLEAIGSIEKMAERRQKQQSHLIEHMQERVIEMEERLQVARAESQADALTGLSNRRALQIQMERVTKPDETAFLPVTFILVDIDHFKRLNDTHGHPAGDACIRALANCLASSFPGRDDCVARYGGEEFAILLPRVDSRSGQELAYRLVESVEQLAVNHAGMSLSFTISAGLAVWDRDETLEEWLERADKALYKAKHGGRNQAVLAR
jgi:diguanylate cyclase (GGDEF)-like protein